jgi:arylsulfatase A-like enzyme
MDAVWIILDSLSFESTPFAKDGPNTMPRLAELSQKHGINFTEAYAPGPTSPSSHGSFFTGELPSVTGMYEANPHFNQNIDTIGDKINSETYAISTNPFIFNGLCDSFDEIDNLQNRHFMIFESGSDPVSDTPNSDIQSRYKRYLDFIIKDGTPLRSLVNGFNYKIQRYFDDNITKNNELDQEKYQYANTMNKKIRTKFYNKSSDIFIIANYMDVHAPLDASYEAINKFVSPEYEKNLPIGISGQKVHKEIKRGNEELGELMYGLYKSAIWDLDKKVTPLVEELVDNGSFVIVTADHGNWFRRGRELEESRIHVPLLIFSPTFESGTISHTVNLRSLPRTTMEVVEDYSGGFKGDNLLKISNDQISVTELIHNPHEPGSPVNPHGNPQQSIQYDVATVKSDSRVDYVDDEFQDVRGSNETINELRDHINELLSRDISYTPERGTVNTSTESRLRDLGYLE